MDQLSAVNPFFAHLKIEMSIQNSGKEECPLAFLDAFYVKVVSVTIQRKSPIKNAWFNASSRRHFKFTVLLVYLAISPAFEWIASWKTHSWIARENDVYLRRLLFVNKTVTDIEKFPRIFFNFSAFKSLLLSWMCSKAHFRYKSIMGSISIRQYQSRKWLTKGIPCFLLFSEPP